MNEDKFARWPDGFMAPVGDVGCYPHRSDDFEVVIAAEYDAGWEPTRWFKVKDVEPLVARYLAGAAENAGRVCTGGVVFGAPSPINGQEVHALAAANSALLDELTKEAEGFEITKSDLLRCIGDSVTKLALVRRF